MQCQKLKTYMETGRVIFLPARTIATNPDQPRKVFQEAALQELGYSAAEISAALKGADPNASTEELIRHALRAMVMKN